MGEVSVRRMVAIAVVASALVGGAVAGGVTAVSASAKGGSSGSSQSSSASTTTAAVVRTDLTTSVQVGGSISYAGSYTVSAPSGSSTQQVTQAQQTVTEDQQTLSADQEAAVNGSTADNQATAVAQTTVNSAQSALVADQGQQTQACDATGASSTACSQAAEKVTQDQTQLTQAQQQLASAQASATSNGDQSQAKIQGDQTKLQGDQATLAALQATATSPGTTYTWLPGIGAVISQDHPVYSVSNQPVPLLYGSIPAYRAFYVGMSDGADVGELTQDLIALGYGAGLTQSNHYSAATAAAVKAWQAALGLAASGEILLGQIVFETGPIRVISVTPAVGSSLGAGGTGSGSAGGGGGTVLTATSTTPIVTVDLAVTQEYLVKPGDAVSITLPDGTSTVGGRIETVGNVATCPGGASTGSGSTDQSPCSSSGSGTSSTPTVPVTIALDSTPPGATLDQAPVNVNVTTQRVNNVLAAPVNALLALQGGGFGVDVVSNNSSHLVGITTGVYSDTLVQITGSGITAGTRVEVPSS
jgi:Putative peptidoglycan binding domain